MTTIAEILSNKVRLRIIRNVDPNTGESTFTLGIHIEDYLRLKRAAEEDSGQPSEDNDTPERE